MTLHQGDTVIIVSPAGRVLDANIDNAVATLQSWGLNVLVSAHAKGEFFNFSGTKEERLTDLQWALDHKEAKVIFASRGGYGVIHLLDGLDWNIFQHHPKMLVGYSDITNLHAQINNLGIESLHALMPNSFPELGSSNTSLKSLKEFLFNENATIEWETTVETANLSMEAEVVGGNLSILYSLQGTPYAPDYTNKILFIEDVSEYLYHTDRMLYNFELSGVFEKLKGIIVGDFTDMKDNDRPFGKSLEQLILDAAKKYGIPVAFGLKTGHGSPTIALPLGKRARFDVNDGKCSLKFL